MYAVLGMDTRQTEIRRALASGKTVADLIERGNYTGSWTEADVAVAVHVLSDWSMDQSLRIPRPGVLRDRPFRPTPLPPSVATAARVPSEKRRPVPEEAPVAPPPPAEPQTPPDSEAATAVRIRMTPKQAEVTRLLCQGMRNADIAEEMQVSVDTVKTHVKNALSAASARDRVHLVVMVLRGQIVVLATPVAPHRVA